MQVQHHPMDISHSTFPSPSDRNPHCSSANSKPPNPQTTFRWRISVEPLYCLCNSTEKRSWENGFFLLDLGSVWMARKSPRKCCNYFYLNMYIQWFLCLWFWDFCVCDFGFVKHDFLALFGYRLSVRKKEEYLVLIDCIFKRKKEESVIRFSLRLCLGFNSLLLLLPFFFFFFFWVRPKSGWPKRGPRGP